MDYFFLRSPLSPLFSEQPADELAIFLSLPDFQNTVQEYDEGKLKDKKVEMFFILVLDILLSELLQVFQQEN